MEDELGCLFLCLVAALALCAGISAIGFIAEIVNLLM